MFKSHSLVLGIVTLTLVCLEQRRRSGSHKVHIELMVQQNVMGGCCLLPVSDHKPLWVSFKMTTIIPHNLKYVLLINMLHFVSFI